MNAIELLEEQHREVEALFRKIERAEGREQKTLFAQIAEKLEAHTKIEEKFLYPNGRQADKEMTLEAYEEHNVAKALIAKIKKTKTSDETFMAKVTVLKEVIEHHVEEEEGEYFPKLEKTLGEEKLEELGEKMEVMFDRLTGNTKKAGRDSKEDSRVAA